jgi:hypothetical protein
MKKFMPTAATPGTPADSKQDFLEGYISEEDYARGRGVSMRTAQRDRQLRQSPPFTRLGRKIYYRIEAVKEWLRSQEEHKDRIPTAPRAKKRKYIAASRRDGRGFRNLRAHKTSRSLPGSSSSDFSDSNSGLPSNKGELAT